jgi:ubiquinone/menaquinone biosynthesis C-methylase UbiE
LKNGANPGRDMQDYLEILSTLEDRLKVSRKGKIDNITRISWELDSKHIMRKAFEASVPGQRVLDVGCGTGTYIIALAKKKREGHGADPLVTISLSTANKKAKEESTKIFLYRAIGEYLPCKDEMFDLVLCLSTLQHVADQKSTLREIRRVLKHDGKLLISIPTNKNIRTLFREVVPEYFTAAFSAATIRRMLANEGFQILETTASGFFPPLLNKALQIYYAGFGEKMAQKTVETLNKVANMWRASAGNLIVLCRKLPP